MIGNAHHIKKNIRSTADTVGSDDAIMQREEMKRVDKAITQQLKEEKRQRKRDGVDSQVTVLVVGSRGSGKTTLIKLLKILLHYRELRNERERGRGPPRGPHNEGISEEPFSEEDKKEYITLIYKNIFTAIKELVLAMRKYSIQYEDPSNEELWEQFANIDANTMTEVSSDYWTLIKQLWNDSGVHKECYKLGYERRKEFNLAVSAKYFLDSLDRISSKWYSPTIEDILRVYEPTTDTVSYSLSTMRVMEIGNQSLERPNKWIQLFNRVCAAICYVVDISEYDMIVESSQAITNRLEASRLLFEKFCRLYVCPTSVVLCFTKKDIFDEKIYESDLVDHFPAYTGPKQNSDTALAFISDMFRSAAATRMSLRTISICATNVDSTRAIFLPLQECIIDFHLKEAFLW